MLKTALSFLFILLFNIQSLAAPKLCSLVYKKGILGGTLGYGKEIEFDLYKAYERILFLSDGSKDTFGYRSEARNEPGAFSLAERVAEKFPEKEITQSDFNIQGDSTVANLRSLFVDNSKELPFAKDAFDLIILRKGLCLCSCRAPCAGFSTKYQESVAFFKEIISTLDLSNPKALAVLHGQESSNPKVIQRWHRIAEELEAQFPVEISFGFAKPGWGFEKGSNLINAVPRLLQAQEGTGLGEFNAIYIRPSKNNNDPLPPL